MFRIIVSTAALALFGCQGSGEPELTAIEPAAGRVFGLSTLSGDDTPLMRRQLELARLQANGSSSIEPLDVEWLGTDLVRVSVPGETGFEADSAQLRAPLAMALARLAGILMLHEPERAVVIGHADSSGDQASNQDLSERRAKAVIMALASHGISPLLLDAIGRGDRQPRADNATVTGRQSNRRVDIMISYRPF